MKKTTLLLTAFAASFAVLTSCGSKKDDKGAENKDAQTSESAVDEEKAPAMKEFKSEAGKFTINFKETPTEQEQDVPTAVGNVKMYMFMHEESRSKAYMVAYCDYPADMIKEANAVDLLQGSKEGVVGKFEAKITNEKVGKFQGNEAIDFTASGPQYHTAYKLVLAGNRLYQVGILEDSGPVSQSDIDTFIGSFKIEGQGN
jgi:hypothetical protein